MKKFTHLLLILFAFTSCEKEINENEQFLELKSTAQMKTSVCHKGDNEIIISINAVETHRAHGDAIDMDGDGYYDKENVCSDGVDCDDSDPEVFPGSGVNIQLVPSREGMGSAVQFDGVDAKIEVQDSGSLLKNSEITISVWVKPTINYASDSWKTILSKFPNINEYPDWGHLYLVLWEDYGSGLDYVGIRLAGVNLSFGSFGNQIWFPTQIHHGVWTHLAFSYDGSRLKAYVNGLLVDQQDAFGTPLLASNTNPLYIGYNTEWPEEVFDGLIDEVQLFDGVLSAAQVEQIYTSPGSLNGEVLHFTCDEFVPYPNDPTVQMLFDGSDNGNHGFVNVVGCPITQ